LHSKDPRFTFKTQKALQLRNSPRTLTKKRQVIVRTNGWRRCPLQHRTGTKLHNPGVVEPTRTAAADTLQTLGIIKTQ
jgi:hypothetical protein